MQHKLFGDQSKEKTYRAIRHDYTRLKQDEYSDDLHHPIQKIKQIENVLSKICNWSDLTILELFAGQGNLTEVYSKFGDVTANEYKKVVFDKLNENVKDLYLVNTNKVDSFLDFHRLIYLKQKFDVIDLDPYGFPTRFFPDVFLLIENGVLFVTMPKPYVNILNGITQTHLISYFGESNPSKEKIIERIVLWGLCHWREVNLINCLDLKSVWRIAFSVKKVKATDYTGVKNR